MTDSWATLLAAAEREQPTICAELTRDWPVGTTEQFELLGLLRVTTPLAALACDGCPGEPYREVVWIENVATACSHAYLQCPECGPREIAADALHCWMLDWSALLNVLGKAFEVSGRCDEVVAGRLWRLGKVRWTRAPMTIFIGRALHCRDAGNILARVEQTPSAVLIVPRRLPVNSTAVPVLPLDVVCSWDGQSLAIDREYVAAQLRAPVAEPSPPRTRKRASRTALIERLTRELADHVRAARDHAYSAVDRTGEPALLPRPNRRELARRCGVGEVAVGRCFRDESARELRYLWVLASDLDRLLEGSAPRR